MNGPGPGYETAELGCDIIMSACDPCGKHTPPNECELCLSDAYLQCPKVMAAIENYNKGVS